MLNERTSPGAVRRLLEHGSAPDAQDNRGSTPLHRAVTNTGAGGTGGRAHDALAIARLLVDAGADVDAANKNGRTPRDACRGDEMRSVLGGWR